MKPIVRSLYAIVLLVLILTACGPRATATQAAPADAPPTQAPEATATALVPTIELVTLDLSGPEAGAEMQWPDGGSLLYVPGGEFQMGAGGVDNPEHTLLLSPYWIYRTKVTNRMYGMCVAVGVCTLPQGEQAASDLENRYLLDRPVVEVSWQQAQAYCVWAEGSLPTEAQWEMAARGPEGYIYPWGDAAPTCDLLNFNDCLGKTSRVFDYLNGASPFNALDMAGNAFEWVGDWYDDDYYPNGPDEDPEGPRVGTERVVRGSSFESDLADVPSSQRFREDPNRSRPDLGYRCVVAKPRVFAPYCQTSAYVPGDAGETPPSRSCDVGNREIARGCRQVTHEIDGAGELRAVRGSPPLTGCSIIGSSGRVTCTGPASVTGVVAVVVACGDIEGLTPADPTCGMDYDFMPGSEVTCEMVPDSSSGEAILDTGCPLGTDPIPGPEGTTLCVGGRGERYEEDEELLLLEGECPGGALPMADTGECPEPEPRLLEPVEEMSDPCMVGMTPATGADGTPICRGTTPDGTSFDCPTGSLPMRATDGRVVCLTRGSRSGEPCPPGTSGLMGGAVCAGLARLPGPGGGLSSPCLEGVIYDAALGCCQAPEGADPGCGEDEYLDTVHGCQPHRDSSGALVTIISFSASTGACGGPGGDSPCGAITGDAACNATAGCHWDYDPAVKACVPD